MKLLKKILSINNSQDHKMIKILGLKIKLRRKFCILNNHLHQILDKLNDDGKKCELLPLCCDQYNDYSDFSELYVNLIKDLDDESIKIVSSIISRLNLYKNNKCTKFILDKNEKKHLENLREWQSNNIVKLNENMYIYKNYILPVNYFLSAVFEAEHDISEIKNIDKNKCIIDAGAFIGDSALILSQYTNDKVYSFEPTGVHYKKLLKTIEYNGLKNVVPVKQALSNNCGVSEIEVVEHGGGSSVCKVISCNEKTYCEKVEFTTLDKFAKDNNLQVGLIKVDVEGAEQLFLEGAKETICSQKPVLLISIYHNSDDFFHIKPLIESWNLGYKFKIRKDAYDTILCDTMLIAEI